MSDDKQPTWTTDCPLCGADLRGDEIPENRRHMYGNATHYSNMRAVEVDGTVTHFECPKCLGRIELGALPN